MRGCVVGCETARRPGVSKLEVTLGCAKDVTAPNVAVRSPLGLWSREERGGALSSLGKGRQ